MKKTVLFISIVLMSFGGLLAQSITVTSIDSNPAEVNSDFTVYIEYSTTNANDIIYIGLERKNSDGSWSATIAEAFINPVGSNGTDVSTSAVVSVPSDVTPSTDLTAGQYYDLKVELNGTGWSGWLAGDYPAMTLVAEGTLSIDDKEMNKVKVYPNPTSDKLNILGVSGSSSKILIRSLLGHIVFGKNNFQDSKIDISEIASGIYILSIEEENRKMNKKFIKE